ncbi:SMI1/KNR4 family protein [uncultured Imperialibacter sp.]|uniref:SMI1/KNR4 family protein n=1 Tax=uncultured Imperialibacter sp. TaxID=1672639 RepID=UPI0030DD4DC2|tara:strand:- start:78664 stop:79389 length:726 start_codon:yes stop_codon:yes gene_type:complete
MTNVDIIKKLKKSTFTDEDGEKYKLGFELALTDDEILHLSKRFPSGKIAVELEEILKETKGWSGYGLETAYFDSIDEFGFTELIPHSVTLGHDGFGNYWVLEVKDDGDLGSIYFACHDPAVLVLYCKTLNEYFESLVEFFESPDHNYLNEVHEKVVMDIWKTTPNTDEIADFRKKNSDLSSFLAEFTDDDWVVADLRRAKKADGFAWGKFGPSQFTKKHPTESVWVIRKKKKGFLSKLFGR